GDTEVRRVASSRLGRRWAPPLRSNRGDRVLEGSSGYGGVIGRPVARGNRGGDALLLVGQRGEIALLQLGASRHGAEIGADAPLVVGDALDLRLGGLDRLLGMGRG